MKTYVARESFAPGFMKKDQVQAPEGHVEDSEKRGKTGFLVNGDFQSRETRPHLGPEIHVMTTYPGYE